MPKYIIDKSKLAERLRLLRDRADLTQQEIADKLMKERVILVRQDLLLKRAINTKEKIRVVTNPRRYQQTIMILTPSQGG